MNSVQVWEGDGVRPAGERLDKDNPEKSLINDFDGTIYTQLRMEIEENNRTVPAAGGALVYSGHLMSYVIQVQSNTHVTDFLKVRRVDKKPFSMWIERERCELRECKVTDFVSARDRYGVFVTVFYIDYKRSHVQ